MFVIVNKSNPLLFWNNGEGWVGFEDADHFSQSERDRFYLPLEGEWILESQATDELKIPLTTGCSLRCGPSHDGDMYGGYVRICDPDGNEILYWDCAEWEDDPELVMGAIFGASLTPFKELVKDRVLEEGYWNFRGKHASNRKNSSG